MLSIEFDVPRRPPTAPFGAVNSFIPSVATCLPQAMTTEFTTKTFVFDPRPNYPLVSVVKRYRVEDSPTVNDPTALTLILIHGIGFHKEVWEPCMHDLLQAKVTPELSSSVKIREVWAMDLPNHGDSAVLNEAILKTAYDTTIYPWEEFARIIHLFLCGYGSGVDCNFSGHNLVGIGHSIGATSLTLSLGYYPRVNFLSLILCEPMLTSIPFMEKKLQSALIQRTNSRKYVWPSKEEAYRLLKTKGRFSSWDDRVLRRYTESGLRPLRTKMVLGVSEGVTLKCTRAQELACYGDVIGHRRGLSGFKNVVKQVPTHLIYGEIDDFIPKPARAEILESIGGVGHLASFACVPSAGHLVVQVNPKGLADKIYNALAYHNSRGTQTSFEKPKL